MRRRDVKPRIKRVLAGTYVDGLWFESSFERASEVPVSRILISVSLYSWCFRWHGVNGIGLDGQWSLRDWRMIVGRHISEKHAQILVAVARWND